MYGIEGATITEGATGIYKNEVEKTINIILYEVDIKAVELLCEVLKMALNQECIAVEIVNNIDIKFM